VAPPDPVVPAPPVPAGDPPFEHPRAAENNAAPTQNVNEGDLFIYRGGVPHGRWSKNARPPETDANVSIF
jgi:hypothetical protein